MKELMFMTNIKRPHFWRRKVVSAKPSKYSGNALLTRVFIVSQINLTTRCVAPRWQSIANVYRLFALGRVVPSCANNVLWNGCFFLFDAFLFRDWHRVSPLVITKIYLYKNMIHGAYTFLFVIDINLKMYR